MYKYKHQLKFKLDDMAYIAISSGTVPKNEWQGVWTQGTYRDMQLRGNDQLEILMDFASYREHYGSGSDDELRIADDVSTGCDGVMGEICGERVDES